MEVSEACCSGVHSERLIHFVLAVYGRWWYGGNKAHTYMLLGRNACLSVNTQLQTSLRSPCLV